ncbi:MAG: hypothetical protein AAGD04_11275 [Pseudomonadota bacterium]
MKSDWISFEWPGGRGVEVAEVRVVLSDLALYFSSPMILDGNTLALILASSDAGPISVAAEIMDERDLTESEIEQFGFSFQYLHLIIGRTTDPKAAKSFVKSKFPSWAKVYFIDEHPNGRPEVEPYTGPSQTLVHGKY